MIAVIMFKIFILFVLLELILCIASAGYVMGRNEPIKKEYDLGYYLFTAVFWLFWLYWLWKVLELVS